MQLITTGNIYIKLNDGSKKLFYSSYKRPYIANSLEGLSNLDIDNLLINPGDFMDDLKLFLYDYSSGNKIFEINLLDYSDYIERLVDDNPFSDLGYVIPIDVLPIFSVENGKSYDWALVYSDNKQVDFIVTSNVSKTVGSSAPPSAEDTRHEEIKDAISSSTEQIVESNKELQNSIDNQTQAIEENNQTNKNIFEKIGDILSYINPFSENFFGKKLVDLIINGIKSLFIPGDDFFSNFFNDLNDWFSDRFGFLYYPLELLFDVLNRFLNINFSNPIINIPNIVEPFTGEIFIKATQFNFNDLLTNNTLKNVHDIYLIIVDAVIYVGLVLLLYNKYEEVIAR